MVLRGYMMPVWAIQRVAHAYQAKRFIIKMGIFDTSATLMVIPA